MPPPDPAERIVDREAVVPAEPVRVSSRERLSSLSWERPWWVPGSSASAAGTLRRYGRQVAVRSRGSSVEGHVMAVQLIRRRVPLGNRLLGLALAVPYLVLTDLAWMAGVFALLITVEFAVSATRGRSVWLQRH